MGGGCRHVRPALTDTVGDLLGRGPDDDHKTGTEDEGADGPEPVKTDNHSAETAADAPALHEALAVSLLAVAVDGDDVLNEGKDEGRGGFTLGDGADAYEGRRAARGQPAHDGPLQSDLQEEQWHGDGE